LVLVSISTEKPTSDKLEGMIYSRIQAKLEDRWRTVNIGFSILLIAVLFALWWIFR
jgi:hypothetical protein